MGNGEGASLPFLGLEAQLSATSLNDKARQAQAKPGSFGVKPVDVVRPEELFKHARPGFLGNPDAVVLDRPRNEAVLRFHLDVDSAAGVRILDSIGHKVADNLPEQLAVHPDGRNLVRTGYRDLVAALCDLVTDLLQDIFGQFTKTPFLEVHLQLAALEPPNAQQIIDHVNEALRGGMGVLDELPGLRG